MLGRFELDYRSDQLHDLIEGKDSKNIDRCVFLDDFLIENQIEIVSDAYEMCINGWHHMRESEDSVHDEHHVRRMIEDLNFILANNQENLREKVNFNILLPAIFNHDASRPYVPTNGIKNMLRDLLMEGRNSSKIFDEDNNIYFQKGLMSVKDSISIDSYLEIKKLIEVHTALYQKKSNKGIEADLLIDLDTLDSFSEERIELLKQKYLKEYSIENFRFACAVYFYIRFFHGKSHFDCTQELIDQRRNTFLKEYLKVIKDFYNNRNKIFDYEVEKILKEMEDSFSFLARFRKSK